MRSQLLLRASARGGRTVLDANRGQGQVVARQTGAERVHLVGQAAGPLNGDELEVVIEIGPAARLEVASTAATIALPGAGRNPSDTSRIRVCAVLAEGAELAWTPEPLVVAAGASVRLETELHIAAGSRARFVETIVLGRHGEMGGQVRTRLQVVREGAPVLSQTLDGAILDRTGRWTGRAERVLATDLRLRPDPWPQSAAVVSGAVAMQPLPGVLLASATSEGHLEAASALARAVGAIIGPGAAEERPCAV